MTEYKVSANEHGRHYEKWFSTQGDAERFARELMKRGYDSTLSVYRDHDYSTPKVVYPFWLSLEKFFRAV